MIRRDPGRVVFLVSVWSSGVYFLIFFLKILQSSKEECLILAWFQLEVLLIFVGIGLMLKFCGSLTLHFAIDKIDGIF